MKTIKPTPNRSLALVAILAAAGTLLFLFQFTASDTSLAKDKVDNSMPLAANSEQPENFDLIHKDEADAPRPQTARELSNEETVSSPASTSIDAQFVERALQKVKVDKQGNVVIDHDALETLYDAVGYGSLRLTSEELAQVQAIIRKGLPDKAGKQAAEIVGNFNHYLEAKKQIDQMYQHRGSATEQRFKVQELRSLRRIAFGVDQAERLFSRQEAHEDYMLANMAISLDEELTEEEREQRREELKKELLETDYGIANWSTRHENFLQQKKAILNTSLSATEKSEQINGVFRQQFTAEEADRIEHLDLAEF